MSQPQPPTSTARHARGPERIHAAAIYCSDGRWGNAFDEFCHEGSGLPTTTASRCRERISFRRLDV